MSQSRDLTAAIRSLTSQANAERRERMKARGAAQSEESAALLDNPAKSSGGDGIASPLIEQAYSARTFHADVTLTSTDGLFSIKIKPVDKVVMIDANGNTCEFQYKAPT